MYLPGNEPIGLLTFSGPWSSVLYKPVHILTSTQMRTHLLCGLSSGILSFNKMHQYLFRYIRAHTIFGVGYTKRAITGKPEMHIAVIKMLLHF